MKKQIKKIAALGITAAMALSASMLASAEGETLRVLNWGNTEEEQIANDAIARFNEAYPDVTVEQTCVPVESWSEIGRAHV